MKTQQSRRKFLQSSALLTLSSLCISPALAVITHEKVSRNTRVITDNHPQAVSDSTLQTRADIRSIDFDSHDFLLNYR